MMIGFWHSHSNPIIIGKVTHSSYTFHAFVNALVLFMQLASSTLTMLPALIPRVTLLWLSYKFKRSSPLLVSWYTVLASF